jgi:hypothetical protein
MIGEPFQSAIFEGLPPMAVPMTVKMPEPMTAPIPRAVRETGPRVLVRACSGRSESEISLSIDFVRKIWRGSGALRIFSFIGIQNLHENGRSGGKIPRHFAR